MKIDISYLDEWLLWKENYTQEDREIIIEAVEEYIKYIKEGRKINDNR